MSAARIFSPFSQSVKELCFCFILVESACYLIIRFVLWLSEINKIKTFAVFYGRFFIYANDFTNQNSPSFSGLLSGDNFFGGGGMKKVDIFLKLMEFKET